MLALSQSRVRTKGDYAQLTSDEAATSQSIPTTGQISGNVMLWGLTQK